MKLRDLLREEGPGIEFFEKIKDFLGDVDSSFSREIDDMVLTKFYNAEKLLVLAEKNPSLIPELENLMQSNVPEELLFNKIAEVVAANSEDGLAGGSALSDGGPLDKGKKTLLIISNRETNPIEDLMASDIGRKLLFNKIAEVVAANSEDGLAGGSALSDGGPLDKGKMDPLIVSNVEMSPKVAKS